MGKGGVGFAPADEDDNDRLIGLIEGVEDSRVALLARSEIRHTMINCVGIYRNGWPPAS